MRMLFDANESLFSVPVTSIEYILASSRVMQMVNLNVIFYQFPAGDADADAAV